MIGIALMTILVGLIVVVWLLKKKHDETYAEILITYPFDSLKKGRVAVFKSDLRIKVEDFVLIRIPGYDMIWKVENREGEKLKLVNRKGETLIGFPVYYIWGKMIGYKNYDKGISNKENYKEDTI